MKLNRESTFCIITSLAAIAIMSLVEHIIAPPYAIKSLIKVIVFHLPILVHVKAFRKRYSELIGLRYARPTKKLILVMTAVYLFIILAFLIARNMIDLSEIRESLFRKEGLSRDNFIFIFSYIILCNSYLEESFFRGYISENSGANSKIISALLFALYHVSIMTGWFSPVLFVLLITGLFFAAMILQYISDKEGTILAGWLVHAFANLAINTIGTIMILGK